MDRAKNCGQFKILIGEEQANEWTTGLLRISRWEAKTFVGLITGQTEVNYNRHEIGRATNSDFLFCGIMEETTTHILCLSEALSNKMR